MRSYYCCVPDKAYRAILEIESIGGGQELRLNCRIHDRSIKQVAAIAGPDWTERVRGRGRAGRLRRRRAIGRHGRCLRLAPSPVDLSRNASRTRRVARVQCARAIQNRRAQLQTVARAARQVDRPHRAKDVTPGWRSRSGCGDPSRA
jgi:hypothetical protein